jgi:DNA invertase Pin-like site-specific DNA recombinase
MNRTAAAYIRVSTDEQRLGPEAQRAAIASWAAREGVEVVAWFEDLGASGAAGIDKRPGLAAALESLEKGSQLVVAKRDRLARDVLLSAMLERLATRSGACIVSADGTGNEQTPEGQLMRSMVAAFAEYERQLIRARTKAALSAKSARGERVSGLAPMGCRFEGGRVVADDAERRVLRDVEALRRNGWTLDAIATELNRRGVVTRSGGSHTTSSVWRIVEALKVGSGSRNRTDSRKKEVAA